MVQSAIAEFVREGHYLRHLRKMKRLYAGRRDLLLDHLAESGLDQLGEARVAGLTILLNLPAGTRDIAIAEESQKFRLAPIPLSTWYATPATAQSGLLLSITNYAPKTAEACVRLVDIIKSLA
jgi:GntR family transcriptional regulator/MocR family aminotransferase